MGGQPWASRRSELASTPSSWTHGNGQSCPDGEFSSPPCRLTRTVGGRGRAMDLGAPPGARALAGSLSP
eukprot:5414816-Lingulodinium_polyedra.AAC.1